MKNLFCILLIAIFFSGCGFVDKYSSVIPNTAKENIKTYCVVHSVDDKDKIDYMIKNSLAKFGAIIVNNPKEADILVTYITRWFWDLGTFLVDLKIQFRDSSDGFPMLIGEVKRVGIHRKDPKFMVDEVIEDMMNKRGLVR